MRAIITSLLLLLIMAGCSPSPTATSTGIQYAAASSAQGLNLYLPEGKGPFPVVIMIHGGAFLFGDESDVGPGFKGNVDALKAKGIAVASIGYRLSDEAPFPAAVQDVKAAIRYLRHNAAAHQVDPERFALWGKSAGANLALVAGLASGAPAFDDPELADPAISDRVRAIVAFYPPVDFAQMDRQLAAQGCEQGSGPMDGAHDAADSPESKYLGAPIQSVPAKVQQANPISYITPDAPAVYLSAGSADCMVPAAQSKLMFEALRRLAPASGAQLYILDGAGHADSAFEQGDSLKRTVNFLYDALKG